MSNTSQNVEKTLSPLIAQLKERITGERAPAAPRTHEATLYGKHLWHTLDQRAQIPKVRMGFEQTESFVVGLARFKVLWLENLENERILKNDPTFAISYTIEQQKIVHELVKYFINDPSCIYPLHKGLCLCGGVGSGKSSIMKVCCNFAKGGSKEFEFTNFEFKAEKAKKDLKYDVVQELIQFPRLLDEIGYSDTTINDHGTISVVLEDVLYQRTYKHSMTGQITHLTTNKSEVDMCDLVGPRIKDRLNAAVTFIVFKGESKRK
jgi:hypothetical protein